MKKARKDVGPKNNPRRMETCSQSMKEESKFNTRERIGNNNIRIGQAIERIQERYKHHRNYQKNTNVTFDGESRLSRCIKTCVQRDTWIKQKGKHQRVLRCKRQDKQARCVNNKEWTCDWSCCSSNEMELETS